MAIFIIRKSETRDLNSRYTKFKIYIYKLKNLHLFVSYAKFEALNSIRITHGLIIVVGFNHVDLTCPKNLADYPCALGFMLNFCF